MLVELGNLTLCSSHCGLIEPPWQDGVTVIGGSALSHSLVTQPFITLRECLQCRVYKDSPSPSAVSWAQWSASQLHRPTLQPAAAQAGIALAF